MVGVGSVFVCRVLLGLLWCGNDTGSDFESGVRLEVLRKKPSRLQLK